jgi:anti-anti-sigma factor
VSTVREVSYCRHGTVAVIAIPACFDIFNAAHVRETAIALQAAGVTSIVFDLAAVTFIDNTALGVIAGTSTRLAPAGGQAAVAGAATQVARLLKATGLAKTVPLLPTPKEAVSVLRELSHPNAVRPSRQETESDGA